MKHIFLSPPFWLGGLVISFFLGVDDKNLKESFAWDSMSKNIYFQFFD